MKVNINLKLVLVISFIISHSFIIYGQRVYISEVLYDTPLHEHLFSSYTNYAGKEMFASHNGEYIELYNPASSNVNISNWRIEGYFPREVFKFPSNTIIQKNSYIMIVYRNYATPTFNIGTVLPELLNYEGSGKIFYHNAIKLSNRGEQIRLYDNLDNLVDWMEYDGTTAIGESKPKLENGETPLYAKNGGGSIETFPYSLSLHRLNVLRNSSGNAYFKRSSWGHKRITPLGLTTNVSGVDFEQLLSVPQDFYSTSNSNINQTDLVYIKPEPQPVSLQFQDDDIIFNYDNAGNRILRTIFIRQTKSPKVKPQNEEFEKEPINHKIGNKNIIIYPNPTKGLLKVQVDGQDNEATFEVFVYSSNGNIILQKSQIGTNTNAEIDISSQNTGIYILRMIIEGKSYNWRIIKE